MEMGGATLDPEVREGLARSWKALMAVGVVAISIGCVAIIVPEVASVGTAIFIGWILVIAGAFLVAGAFMARGQQNAGLVGLSGVCGLLIGILVLAKFPSSADWAIGLLVGIDLIFAGWTLTSVAMVGKELAKRA